MRKIYLIGFIFFAILSGSILCSQDILDPGITKKKIKIISIPEGASVYVKMTAKGKFNLEGQTPLELNIKIGWKEIIVKKDGYEDFKGRINSQSMKEFTAQMKKIPTASLDIKTLPENAEIYLNGNKAGVSGNVIADINPGKYKLLIQKEGFENLEEELDLSNPVLVQKIYELRELKVEIKYVEELAEIDVEPDVKKFYDAEEILAKELRDSQVEIQVTPKVMGKIKKIAFLEESEKLEEKSFASAYTEYLSMVLINRKIGVLERLFLENYLKGKGWNAKDVKFPSKAKELKEKFGISHIGFVKYSKKYVRFKVFNLETAKSELNIILKGPHRLKGGAVFLETIFDSVDVIEILVGTKSWKGVGWDIKNSIIFPKTIQFDKNGTYYWNYGVNSSVGNLGAFVQTTDARSKGEYGIIRLSKKPYQIDFYQKVYNTSPSNLKLVGIFDLKNGKDLELIIVPAAILKRGENFENESMLQKFVPGEE
ncbi:MAG TPA: hypothetical protein DHW82_03845 [Spirochaetia bacterium]|nr:MAG: hypothetical protein A2Y41_06795 [Spirochaetes bacterium GWB1_36_13]HCL56126.1 hypothetical protein [Spirochaetia bacterium]